MYVSPWFQQFQPIMFPTEGNPRSNQHGKWLVPPAVEDVVQDFMATFLPQRIGGSYDDLLAPGSYVLLDKNNGSYDIITIIDHNIHIYIYYDYCHRY